MGRGPMKVESKADLKATIETLKARIAELEAQLAAK